MRRGRCFLTSLSADDTVTSGWRAVAALRLGIIERGRFLRSVVMALFSSEEDTAVGRGDRLVVLRFAIRGRFNDVMGLSSSSSSVAVTAAARFLFFPLLFSRRNSVQLFKSLYPTL